MIKNSAKDNILNSSPSGVSPINNLSAIPGTKSPINKKVMEAANPPTKNLLEKNPILKIDWVRLFIFKTLNNWVIARTAKAAARAFAWAMSLIRFIVSESRPLKPLGANLINSAE